MLQKANGELNLLILMHVSCAKRSKAVVMVDLPRFARLSTSSTEFNTYFIRFVVGT